MVKQNLLEIVEKIVALDANMRFASIIDLNGNILEGIMNQGKNSLESRNNKNTSVNRFPEEEK